MSQVAQSVSCLTRDWAARVQSLAEAKDFPSILCILASSGDPASYPVDTGDPFSGMEVWPERDTDHSLPSSSKVGQKWVGAIPPVSPHASTLCSGTALCYEMEVSSAHVYIVVAGWASEPVWAW
jgi:hypothetical protein